MRSAQYVVQHPAGVIHGADAQRPSNGPNQLPVKNTFIHFDARSGSSLDLTANFVMRSAPAAMLQGFGMPSNAAPTQSFVTPTVTPTGSLIMPTQSWVPPSQSLVNGSLSMPTQSLVTSARSLTPRSGPTQYFVQRSPFPSSELPVKNTFIDFDAMYPDQSNAPTAEDMMKSAPPALVGDPFADPFADTQAQSMPKEVSAADSAKILLREALTYDLCEDILSRLQPGGSDRRFSSDVVVALRVQFGIFLVSELCSLKNEHIAQLEGVSDEEKWRLLQLCESMRKELPHLWNEQEQVPVKNTFIHYDAKTSDLADDVPALTAHDMMQSAPPAMLQQAFHTKTLSGKAAMEATHLAGDCRPCAYFYKNETCRWGYDCTFCHLCPVGEIKARKKEKIKAMRAAGVTKEKGPSPAAVQSTLLPGSNQPLWNSPRVVVAPSPGWQQTQTCSPLPSYRGSSNRVINLFSLT